jgi:hypothetical protein
MSETLNVNVLVAAKEEYTKQLVYILSPEIYKVLLNVFSDSQLLKKKRSVSLRNFQLQLKKIPLWNTIIIEKNTSDIKSKIPYLLDLITAIFVSHVKILACVRLKADSKSINVKVPNLDVFLHKMIIMNAEKIYYYPDIIQQKKEKVILLISDTIEETIRNQIPIDKILTEYLSGVFENDNENTSSSLDKKDNKYDDDSISEIESDNDSDNDSVNDSDNENKTGEDNKSILPTRPLPPGQLPESTELPEDRIPTTEIKNRVFFSDAVEKAIKPNKSENDNKEESDEESDIDYFDEDEHSEEP